MDNEYMRLMEYAMEIDTEAKLVFTNPIAPPLGIDFGTTNCCCTFVTKGIEPEVVLIDGERTMKSCVTWLGGNNFVVGRQSFNRRWNKDDTVYSNKRNIGEDIVYNLTAMTGEQRTFTPIEIGQIMLQYMTRRIGEVYGEVQDVCITVPAEFSPKQISNTIECATRSGLDCITTTKEPTAAAVRFSLDYKQKTKFVVYDLGGGTFDECIIEVTPGVSYPKEVLKAFSLMDYKPKSEKSNSTTRVIKQIGCAKLGGDDLDDLIVEIVAREHDINLKELVGNYYEKLKLAIERYKRSLDTTKFTLDLKYKDGTLKSYDLLLLPDYIEEATKILYDKTMEYHHQLMANPKDSEGISKMILVGGSTKNVYIRRYLTRDMPFPVDSTVNPDEAVGLGAGIAGKVFKFNDLGIKLFDVTPTATGVLTIGEFGTEHVSYLIPRGVSIPTVKHKMYHISDTKADALRIKFYDGDGRTTEIDRCYHLFDVVIDLKDADFSKSSEVDVALKLDAQGLLSVSASLGGIRLDKVVNVKSCKTKPTKTKGSILIDKASSIKDSSIINSIKELATEIDRLDTEDRRKHRKQIKALTSKAMDIIENNSISNFDSYSIQKTNVFEDDDN